MEIRRVPVSKINPAPYNPRVNLKPGDPEYERLKQSLTQFGCVEPLVWNSRTGNLVGGHQRLKVLIEQGAQEIDVSVVDFSITQEKILNIALNKIQGDWNEELLAILLAELTQMPDVDVGLTGFELPEISKILDRQEQSQEDDFDAAAAAGAIQQPVTQMGDLIELGPHRILCGDSSKHDHLLRLFGDERADLVHADYPYNVSYMQKNNRPSTKTRPKKSRKWDSIYSDCMPQEEYEKWMRQVLVNIKQVIRPGAAVYLWQGHRQFPPMYQILLELEFHISCVVCWLKESAAITYGDYSFQTEQCLYGWLTGATHYWAGPPLESNVWQVKRDHTANYQHPTQKPVALAQRAIRNSSKRGDLVLDCFLGSGSTLIAAESLERRCYGVELDPKYCDAIVRRYIAYVGKERVSPDLFQRYGQEVTHV